MNKKEICIVWLFVSLVFLFSCAAGKKDFEYGMQLHKSGKNREAIEYLEKAVKNEPDNEKYKQTLSEVKGKVISAYVLNASKVLNDIPVTMVSLNSAKSDILKAKEIDPDNTLVTKLSDDISEHEKQIISTVSNLYNEAKVSIAAKEWIDANSSLQQIQDIFPDYMDISRLLTVVSEEGSEFYYNKAKAFFDKDDFKAASKNTDDAISIKPDHAPSLQLLVLIKERSNKDYFIEKGRKAVSDKDWITALRAFYSALEYTPSDETVKLYITALSQKLTKYYISTIRNQMDDGRLFQAIETYNLALKNMNNSNSPEFKNIQNELAAKAFSMGTIFKNRKKYGASWFWYNKVKSISPYYPEIFSRNLEMEEKIIQRVQKNIAVFDFSGPLKYEDSGIIATNNLISYLLKNADGCIKVLDRENIKSMLEEMKLEQIGVVSNQTVKRIGQVCGLDIAVLGNILLYNREPVSVIPSADSISVEDIVKDNAVSCHNKTGLIQLSFRIIDAKTGDSIQTKTLENEEIFKENIGADLSETSIEYDPLIVSSDNELFQKRLNELIAEAGIEILKPLKNLEKKYFQEGEQYLEKEEKIMAVESFVNSIFGEKMKMVLGFPLSKKAMEYLENIFRDYKEN